MSGRKRLMTSEEQVSNLFKAIDAARNPGARRYSAGCVIAQLWNQHYSGRIEQNIVTMRHCHVPVDSCFVGVLELGGSKLDEYPRELLTRLQTVWDNEVDFYGNRKEWMKELVRRYYNVEAVEVVDTKRNAVPVDYPLSVCLGADK